MLWVVPLVVEKYPPHQNPAVRLLGQCVQFRADDRIKAALKRAAGGEANWHAVGANVKRNPARIN